MRTVFFCLLFLAFVPEAKAEFFLHTALHFPRDLACLEAAYPGLITGVGLEEGSIWLRLQTGERLLYSSPEPSLRDSDGALHNPTLQETMLLAYPALLPADTPLIDAGRDRSAALFMALYVPIADGAQQRTVDTPMLEPMEFMGESILFASAYGAVEALKRVEAEAKAMLIEHPELAEYFTPLGGAYYYRNIVGTTRKSAHSYGIAIDLHVKKSAYWRWGPLPATPYPMEIVHIFERNGFIWGGRWQHYDTMHFEYRPELLCGVNTAE